MRSCGLISLSLILSDILSKECAVIITCLWKKKIKKDANNVSSY